MKTFKYILFVLLIFIIGFSVFVAVQPNSFEVERNRTIKAPTQVVYNNVIDFKNWKAWNSWKEEDPSIVMTMSDKTNGIGGSYSWTDKDGIGTMKTIDAKANTSITQEMQFGDFPKSDVKWSFTPNEDGSTDVTWNISGKDLPFGFRTFATLMGGMERQIGPYYQRGLEMLDEEIQKDMKRYSVSAEVMTEHSGGFYLYNTMSCKMSNFKEKMQEMFPKIGGYAISNNIRIAGSPFVIYNKFDKPNHAVMFSCAIPTSSKITTTEPDILTGQLEPFKAVKTILYRDYENLEKAWEDTMKFVEENNLEIPADGITIEAYLTDPTSQPNPADWITELYLEVY